jgi:hypothetical protein
MARPKGSDATRQSAGYDATRQSASYDATRMLTGDNTRAAIADEQKRRDDALRDIVHLRGGGKGKERAIFSNLFKKESREIRQKSKEADKYEEERNRRLLDKRRILNTSYAGVVSDINKQYKPLIDAALSDAQEQVKRGVNSNVAFAEYTRLSKEKYNMIEGQRIERDRRDSLLEAEFYRRVDNHRIKSGLEPKYSDNLQKLSASSAIPGASREVGEPASGPEAYAGGDYAGPSQPYAGGDHPGYAQAYGSGDYAGPSQPYVGGDHPGYAQAYGSGDYAGPSQPYVGGDHPGYAQAYGSGDYAGPSQPSYEANLSAQMANVSLDRRRTVFDPAYEHWDVNPGYEVSPIEEEGSRPASFAEGEQ